MERELDIEKALHQIELDVHLEQRLLGSVTCSLDASFADLHYALCEQIHLPIRCSYRFYVARVHASFRYLPRSHEEIDTRKILQIASVGDDIFYRNNRQQYRLKVRSIGNEIEKMNIELNLRRAFVKLQDRMAESAYLKVNRMQRENLSLLYDLGRDLVRMNMSKLVRNQSTLVFNLKGNHLMSYCYVNISNGQIEYFFFRNLESYQHYLLVKRNLYISPLHQEKYKDGISMVFSQKPLKEYDMSKPFAKQFYVENSAYLYFYDVRRGYEVDQLDNTQAKEMMRYLVAFLGALKKIKTFTLELNPSQQAMYIGYNPHNKTALLQFGPKVALELYAYPYDKQVTLERVLTYPRTIETYELDYFLCKRKEGQESDERGAYECECIGIGKDFHNVQAHRYESEENLALRLIDIILDICEELGIPKKILVRDAIMYSYLQTFCEKTEIEMEIFARLPHIDAFQLKRQKKMVNS